MSSKPEIVIVPGAFGTPAGFDKLAKHLHAAGLTTHGAAYPSCNPTDPATASSARDIAHVRDHVLLPLLDAGKHVVVLVHSYGGVVGGAAARGLDRPSRAAAGLEGGVVGLIYMVGNITLENETLLEAVGGAYPPFIKVGKPDKGLAIIEPAMDILYNDLDPGLELKLSQNMQPHALHAFESKPSAPAWADAAFDGKRAYIRTLDDNCNPYVLQNMWIEKSKVEWEIVDFKSGHMPFESRPEELAGEIVKLINKFETL
ncbi:hypothetical protein PFICI_07971 [Pestalotiopsis fici W106-1]|uniref:AB hydrolase-1 domain-containing protein n=1 Tax=Pestalotiopsis fici (strain W106-1 / CGMCC3.15140) TaxID=1229662 RepID=W3X4W4_PESFW|nr:uncharacterized protein PFICI_07971 [Pestalotiopsis fici W106-1]ETS80442.1 hypothetical protein PFICI_07971 [Pestalotiopsis fici W106-1]